MNPCYQNKDGFWYFVLMEMIWEPENTEKGQLEEVEYGPYLTERAAMKAHHQLTNICPTCEDTP